ncbi:Protein of uncharacterised function (DUF2974) [Actinomyces bovis]|uniref:Protein of uncharacterized function (DUF2974) n=1 Tax=Actinomyces bovis TaxID=1658 RepID=A0ABY1VS10_9ACTO|nr:Mbeg1-like protein [Actinomyces bovis]SPT54192.1 Protein of uncharacterised function (DUF2974) [Actinomyces bovis]VEG56571.1 Protein of uncharacterised function (DUF2974) [Actinomyces israelii]
MAAEDIVAYVERMLAPIDAEGFTPVDSLVLSWASYFRVLPDLPAAAGEEGVEIRELLRAECFPRFFWTVLDPDKCKRLLFAMAASPRFRSIRQCFSVDDVDDAQQKQFAACAYVLGPELMYVAFRGTDRTLVGWKEDFNMAFAAPVPAQEAAADYLAALASRTSAKLLLGGHSKGGNLAIYAAARNAEMLGDRLVRVYSHDGPGFLPEFLAEPGFRAIEDRIERSVPQSSIVGMLLDHSSDYTVVKSTNLGPLQHDPFSWVVEGENFARAKGLSFDARRIDAIVSAWLVEHTPEQRELLVDAIYSLITLPEVETVTDLVDSWQRAIPAVRERIGALDPEVRAAILEMLKSLAVVGLRGKGKDASTAEEKSKGGAGRTPGKGGVLRARRSPGAEKH